MAINKVMRAALKALSYPDIDLKKTYRVQRTVQNLTSKQIVKPPAYQMWDHKIICGDHEVPVRIFSPPDLPIDGPTRPVLLFFHGGGWVVGNINSYTKVCANLAKSTGHTVVSVDYRLAPEYKFPAAAEDCYAVARELYPVSYTHLPRTAAAVVGNLGIAAQAGAGKPLVNGLGKALILQHPD